MIQYANTVVRERKSLPMVTFLHQDEITLATLAAKVSGHVIEILPDKKSFAESAVEILGDKVLTADSESDRQLNREEGDDYGLTAEDYDWQTPRFRDEPVEAEAPYCPLDWAIEGWDTALEFVREQTEQNLKALGRMEATDAQPDDWVGAGSAAECCP